MNKVIAESQCTTDALQNRPTLAVAKRRTDLTRSITPSIIHLDPKVAKPLATTLLEDAERRGCSFPKLMLT